MQTDKNALMVCLGTFVIWGILPLYWNLFGSFSASAVWCHRIVWSCVFTTALMTYGKRWKEIIPVFKKKRYLLLLFICATLIGGNWLLYIYAIQEKQLLQSSLGLYMSPLVNVSIACLVFKQKLRRLQVVALIFASAGVAIQTIQVGTFPWISIILAVTFSLYGVLRKFLPIDALPSITIETIMITPLAVGGLVFISMEGQNIFLPQLSLNIWLVSAGIITSVPLIGYTYAAKRLNLITLGLLQYITPTISFLISIFIFKESMSNSMLLMFVFIWIGLFFYSLENIYYLRKHSRRFDHEV